MNSVQELQNKLREALIDLLWDQWRVLGGAGNGRSGAVPFVIDPEALLLATMRFGRTDSRLTGEALDWLARNGKLVSLQRLKNMQSSTMLAGTECLRELAGFMTDASYRNWHSLGQWASKTSPPSGGGFVPEGFQTRGMSQPPDCAAPEAFILRLRALFGVSARPEVLAWLLTHHAGYAAEIARDVSWFSKSVQAILNELDLSRVLVNETAGKRKLYSLNPRSETLHPSFGKGLRWFSQSWFYMGVLHVEATLDALQESPGRSIHAQAIRIREVLPAMNTALRMAGADKVFVGLNQLTGATLVDSFHEGTQSIQNMLTERNFPGTKT
ncbi:MAG: hypothetical protein OSB65_19745 [Roseibacillus sp.]|nr:hypothetical protein [Roseibacillus sp.]